MKITKCYKSDSPPHTGSAPKRQSTECGNQGKDVGTSSLTTTESDLLRKFVHPVFATLGSAEHKCSAFHVGVLR